MKTTLFDSLKMVLFLTVSASAIIAFLALPVSRVVYQHGRYTGYDAWATSRALVLYMLGIPFTAGIRNLAAVFYAYRDAKTPMFASFLGIAVNVGLNLLLMRTLGFQAFPLAISISALVNFGALMLALPRKVGAYELGPFARFFILLAAVSAASGACGWLLNDYLVRLSGAFYFQVISLLASGLLACFVLYILCRILGLKEVDDYLRRLLKK